MGTLGLSLQAPFWGLLGLPLLIGLVALYTIRSQPRHRKLPSLRIWQQVLRKKRPNTLLSRYRNSLFFFLQFLVLLLGILAIMRPFRNSDRSGDLLLVLDNSASMGAMDGRMDQAKEKLQSLIEELEPGARVRLITLGPIPQVLTDFTDQTSLVSSQIDRVQVLEGPSLPPDEVLRHLSSQRSPGTHLVHLVSDHYRPEDFPGGLPETRIRFHYVGTSDENVAITRLDVRPQGESYQVAALIRNYSQLPAEVVLQLHAEGPPEDRRESVPGGGQERLVLFSDAKPKKGILGVGMRVARGPQDRLPCDDHAWAAPRRGAVRVLLVSEAPQALQRALSLEQAIGVTLVSPTELPPPEKLEDFDLVVADGVWSPTFETRPLLLFHPRKATPFSSGQLLENSEMTRLDRTHPVNKYLSLREVRFPQAVWLNLAEDATPLLEAASGPLILAQEVAGTRRILCAFDLASSDLVRRIGFPIFLTNVVRWLLANDSKLKGQFRVGQNLRLSGDGPFFRKDPDGQETPVEAQGGVLSPFSRTGVFSLRSKQGPALAYPVNLLDPSESQIAPVLGAGETLGEAGESKGQGERELWKLLLLASLGGLFLEWCLLAIRGGTS